MTQAKEKSAAAATIVPQQPRAKRTYEAILETAQDILESEGIEAVNSNKIAKQAGVTPPVFYRYFSNKHDLLYVLGKRLNDAQDAVYAELAKTAPPTEPRELEERNFRLLSDIYKVNANFKGGRALTVSLRAIPSLASVRLDANDSMAHLTVPLLREIRPSLSEQEAFERCRLIIEIGYSAIEMLLEVPSMSVEPILRLAAKATTDLFLK